MEQECQNIDDFWNWIKMHEHYCFVLPYLLLCVFDIFHKEKLKSQKEILDSWSSSSLEVELELSQWGSLPHPPSNVWGYHTRCCKRQRNDQHSLAG